MLDLLDNYDVTWDTPSTDISGTMPIGNGDLAANVWVEAATGDVMLLVAKSDAWDENAILLKLGRIRISIIPRPLQVGAEFRQRLRLRDGTIQIVLGTISVRVWVDANHPVIHIHASHGECAGAGAQAFQMRATLESWRTREYQVKAQTGDIFKNLAGKNSDLYPTLISPDHIVPDDNRIIWCHHNAAREHDGYEINLRLQGLGAMLDRAPHPLRGRTFGAAILGDGFRTIDAVTLESDFAPRLGLCVVALTEHPSRIEQWRNKLDQTAEQIRSTDSSQARLAHEQWWAEFWNRSWIYVTSDDHAEDENCFRITQAYVLQRFMNACAGRGKQPIRHNGSIFTVGKPEDPDFRRWGAGYWFQNQRLIYWAMLASGDFDLMRPFFAMYRDSLESQRHRTRTYFNHGGAHYPETIYFWGSEVSGHYGWTPFDQRKHPEAECAYLTYYWSGGIELALMMLDYYEYTGDEDYLRGTLLPVIDAVTEFFDQHYPRDANGKIRFEPAQALETWHWAVNPTPEIAGLRYLLKRLVSPPPEAQVGEQGEGSPAKAECSGSPRKTRSGVIAAYRAGELFARARRMFDELPPIPVTEKEGRRVILPAEQFERKKNTENPELYCVFPYRLYGLGKADLDLARDTFAARLHVEHTCWHQDVIQMALLGLTEQAKDFLVRRAAPECHSESRFPAFWNAFHDWIPDVDHGGVLQIALQSMLMQCDNDEIKLAPAWPQGWNARFRLHAPGGRIVEGDVTNAVTTAHTRSAMRESPSA